MPSHALPPGQSRARRRAKVRGTSGGLLFIVPFSFGVAMFGNGRQEHASILYYVISLAVLAALVIATGLGYAGATRIAAKSVRRRPRWLYLLYALGYSVTVAIFVRFALAHVRSHTANQNSWAALTGGMLALYCSIGGVMMLGRALARGRKRRIFWQFPPQWLDHELGLDSAQAAEEKSGL